MPKVVLFANTDWYLYNFRLPLARALRANGWEVVLVSPGGSYGQKLEASGFCWSVLPMERRSLNPLRELGVLAWLVSFLRREQPDVVHGFTIKCAIYGALAARLTGVSGRVHAVAGMGYVFTSRSLKARLLRTVVSQLMRAALGGRGSMLILQNPDDVKLFKRTGLVDPARIRLIRGSGVNCNRFMPRLPFEETADEGRKRPLHVLLATRLLWDKGIAEYVDAAKMLRAEGRTVRFYLAGATDLGNPATVDQKQVLEWTREGIVTWLGHVNNMTDVLANMDAVVLPSYREGLPRALVEAAACGLPIVTTDVPGCREVVKKSGVDGLLVPPRDSAAIAAAIRTLDDDRALCARLGAAARKTAVTRFDERIVIAQTLAVYKELGEETGEHWERKRLDGGATNQMSDG
jgi:glycosyltransferase involved in cell wall biosynthesis